MCGIAGEFRFDGAPVQAAHITAMTRAIAHRGPDDTGVDIDGPVGLGHRRLSIIDLSAAGHQPMWTEDRAFAMIFNGEVYNFADIRRELESLGERFRSHSDTEVVLRAIRVWGMGPALSRCVGMFALAVWDARARVLTLARDRAGVKPLFVHHSASRVVFGSELRALLAHPDFQRELDQRTLAQFFVLGYWPGTSTPFAGVEKLLPGHFLEIGADGRRRDHTYWTPPEPQRGAFGGTYDEATEHLEHLLTRAFADRLVADVPVGLFLSSGVDSTLLASLLKRRVGAQLLHITIGFREAGFDEAPAAAAVARQLDVPHVVEYLDTPDAVDALHRFVEVYDEPFGDTSGMPTALLSAVARRHVAVALSADGGDEQFFGYAAYAQYPARWRRVAPWPLPLRRGVAALGRAVPYRSLLGALHGARPASAGPQLIAQYEKLLTVLESRSPGDLLAVTHEKGWTRSSVRTLLRQQVDDVLQGTLLADGRLASVTADTLADQMMVTDYGTFLRDDILTKVDRASMAVSLECRDPFLDHRIAEFAAQLPLDFLVHGGERKRILRRLLRKYVSDDVVALPKRGFSIPLYEWMRGPWQPLVRDLLQPSRVARVGVLDPAAVTRTVDRFYRHPGGRAEQVMLLLNFQMWAERWYLR